MATPRSPCPCSTSICGAQYRILRATPLRIDKLSVPRITLSDWYHAHAYRDNWIGTKPGPVHWYHVSPFHLLARVTRIDAHRPRTSARLTLPAFISIAAARSLTRCR